MARYAARVLVTLLYLDAIASVMVVLHWLLHREALLASMQSEFPPPCSMVAVVAPVEEACPRHRHHVAATLRAAWG